METKDGSKQEVWVPDRKYPGKQHKIYIIYLNQNASKLILQLHNSLILLSQATKITDLSAMIWYSLMVRARKSIFALAFLSI
jgi:hypothetical protein